MFILGLNAVLLFVTTFKWHKHQIKFILASGGYVRVRKMVRQFKLLLITIKTSSIEFDIFEFAYIFYSVYVANDGCAPMVVMQNPHIAQCTPNRSSRLANNKYLMTRPFPSVIDIFCSPCFE